MSKPRRRPRPKTEGYHCKTHNMEITFAMSGDPGMDALARNRMAEAVKKHRLEMPNAQHEIVKIR